MTECSETPKIEPTEERCRRVARQIWEEYPGMTIDKMLERYEIKDACEGRIYEKQQLMNWIHPLITAQDELPRLKDMPAWKIEEAVAIWLDLNPFVMERIGINSFWDMQYALSPNLRERYGQLLAKAKISLATGSLQGTLIGDLHYVTPQNFDEWGIKNGGEPSERYRIFFSELEREWEAAAPKKPAGRLDQKRKEILRILDAIKKADPEFDQANMPGLKEDFHKLCKKLNGKLFIVAESTFHDYLSGVCKFNPGARKTDYYEKIASKLG